MQIIRTTKPKINSVVENSDLELLTGSVLKPKTHVVEEPILAVKVIEAAKEAPVKKVKKPRTEKQLESDKRLRELLLQKHKENRTISETKKVKQKEYLNGEQERMQKELDDKLVKKAIAIKKRMIMKQALLDEIPEEDTPIEKVKAVEKKIIQKEVEKKASEPEKPKWSFEK